ncbi:PKD domain-containing protein, partial [Streptomyces sp. S9]|nr:PKD domain-containing protein [Streptomyces sp. S9]
LSARHDPAADPTNTPYAYGHGYRYEPATGSKWRTIMAYNCTGGCPRLNYWSYPDVTYNGVAMGTADRNHNQRVLVQTKAAVAAFRGAPGGNTAPVANFSSSASGLTVSFTDSSTDSDGTIASRSWDFGDGTTSTAT